MALVTHYQDSHDITRRNTRDNLAGPLWNVEIVLVREQGVSEYEIWTCVSEFLKVLSFHQEMALYSYIHGPAFRRALLLQRLLSKAAVMMEQVFSYVSPADDVEISFPCVPEHRTQVFRSPMYTACLLHSSLSEWSYTHLKSTVPTVYEWR
ncbi:hypothetical protein E2C01_058846 [Portunus trituberculatus]|uniref:Uncharacterized protein n=1 Tax=Portunus trituberculatus TaxID=210409 RepID=A0A5B7H492_PORTR|nr:hypothetical protein [Portunus trituberculatus]